MNIEQTRAQVIASVWQAIAQSDVDLSGVPQEQQEKLVSTIANNLLLTVNDLLDEVPEPEVQPEPGSEFDEQELWKGRPFLSVSESYLLTNERIRITKGFVGREIENYELIRIQDLDLSQGLTERILNIGDIHLRGHDPSSPELVLRNVSKPDEVYETLRRAWLAARKRHGLQFREEM
ncbi:MAG TPA: PH domain-containing protein [Anaerolineales bacterium]